MTTAILSHVLPVERIVAESPVVCAGIFRCHPDHPLFPGGQPCSSFCIVFPRDAAWIQHEGARRFVADPSVATFYNRGQVYHRWSIGRRPDRCDWLAFPASIVRDAVRTCSPADAEHSERPFRFGSAALDARAYAAQRQMFETLIEQPREASTTVEERALELLEHLVRQAYGAERAAVRGPASGRTREAVEMVREIIARHPEDRASLADLARAVGLSAFHLCREFRVVTGTTITAFRTELRLRASLERVADGEDLTTIALSLGFFSHSHFTHAFRRLFGATPSAMRGAIRSASRGVGRG
jgi:AraC family transcriptional regulator